MNRQPSRGEIWLVDLDPTRGHEQAGRRPALVLSADPFNHGPAGLVVIAPITSRDKHIPYHVALQPPEGGLTKPSFVKCEDIRSITKERLGKRLGAIRAESMTEVENRVRLLLDL